MTALANACCMGHGATAHALAARMGAAALNLVDSDGKTALDWANEGGRWRDAVEALAPAADEMRERGGLMGMDVDPSANGGRQLLRACEGGRAEAAELLIEMEHADVNFVGEYGRTPLIAASEKGLEAVVERLLHKHAHTDHVNESGSSALLLATTGGHTAVAQLLADRGAKLDLVSGSGRTALILAATLGRFDIAQLLVRRGAKLNLVDREGHSALICAAIGGRADIAQLLVHKGARLDLAGTDGRTALSWACALGRADVALVLAPHMDAAALNHVDAAVGKTALDYAGEGGEDGDKAAELAPAAAAIRARGGMTAVALKAHHHHKK
jgi:ankyrin repeat protein